MPGSTISRARGMPARSQAAMRVAEQIVDVEHHVVVARLVLHGARIALRVHQDDRQAGLGRHLQAARDRASAPRRR